MQDADFEVFIDVSGSTQYYKVSDTRCSYLPPISHHPPTPQEFEMNANNATYDVMWGVPDGAGLNCSRAGQHSYLPTCVNTSFPGYAGSWTMAGTAGGLRTSTSYNKEKWVFV